jgi:hypothetical protein
VGSAALGFYKPYDQVLPSFHEDEDDIEVW